MNSVGLSIIIFLISIILFFPRRWAVLGVTAGVFYLMPGQGLVIWGFNLFSFRLIELAGIVSFIWRKDRRISSINNLDKWFFIFNLFYLSVFLLRYTFDVNSRWNIAYQVGIFVDAAITYSVYRGLLNSTDSIKVFIKDVIYLLIPFTIFMMIEAIKGYNIFSFLSGIQVAPIFRDGYYRCQANFGHPIMAGSVGATLLPIFLFLIFVGGNNVVGGISIILCTVIVLASHSSGPLMAFSFGIMAWMFWPLRKRMRTIRWGIVGLLLSLHAIMKAPVWFLPARISEIIGGDGWHRSNLIDKWIDSIGQWWLLGMPWSNTENWAATKMSWGAVDATNQYVAIGVNGGIISLFLFIYFIIICYKNLGKKIEEARNTGMKNNELLLWGLGASLTSHIINLTGVTYWDQFYVIWYMLLAIISGVTDTPSLSFENNNEITL